MPDDQRRLLGTYTIIPCKKDAKLTEKMEAVKYGIYKLIKEISTFNFIPDVDTIQFIVHEGIHSHESLYWDCIEKDAQAVDAREGLTVGIKFYGTPRRIPLYDYMKETENKDV